MRQPEPGALDRGEAVMPAWNDVLRALRKAAGVTQEGWAARLRYGRRTIQRWERAELPPDASATDEVIRLCGELGLYRTYRQGELAGLSLSAELIRQLLGEARLGSRAASTASAPVAPPHNLPLDLTSFIGRERDLAQVMDMIATGRLVTITGPGGIGKTRLATQAAVRLLDSFSDGVWLVELDGVADETMLPHRVADAVGAIEQPGEEIADTVVASLRPRRLIVVLDGCEHLLNACAALVARLLGTCPRLRIVATSREPLAVPGEAIWRVEPLAVPDTDGDDHLERLTEAEAIRFFQDRASLVRRDFRVNAGNAADVAEICRRLGGIPLALELAAAHVRVLSPAQIAERLRDRFGLLERKTRAESRRHQTLDASIDWSYRLLDPPEQRVFESVSVFAGGFSLEAAEITCADAGVLKILTRLVDKSLVFAKPEVDAEVMRYHLLEPLRAYAAERLRARGDADEVRRRQGDWLITNAERVPGVIHGPEQRRWLGWVNRERANILEAATWWIQRGQPEIPLRLAAALYWPLGILGRGGETRLWLEPALRLTTVGLPVGIRAGAALGAAILAIFQGDRTAASYHLEDATGLAREARDESLVAGAWGADALLLQLSGRFDEAARMAEDGLPEVRRLGNKFMEARALEMQAAHALARGDSEAAKSLLEESARLARRTGDAYSLALAGAGLGDVARSRSDTERARAFYMESIALRESLGLSSTSASLRHNLGYVALLEMDAESAAEHFAAAFKECQRQGNSRGVAECVFGMGAVSVQSGNAADAARLFAAGQAMMGQSGSQIWPSNRADYDRYLSLARDTLGRADFEAAWAQGGVMEPEQATALGLAVARNAAAGGRRVSAVASATLRGRSGGRSRG